MIDREYPKTVRIERKSNEWVIEFDYGSSCSVFRRSSNQLVKDTLTDLISKNYWFARGRAFVIAFRDDGYVLVSG